MLFEFDIERQDDGQYKVYLQFPTRNSDGSYVGSDQLSAVEFDRDTVLVVPFDGSKVSLPSGDVEIEVVDDDGESITIKVTVPDGWVAVDQETFYEDGYGE